MIRNMKEKRTNITMRNRDIASVFVVMAAILLIPLLGNWPWTRSDFVIMGTLLAGTGLLLVLASRKIKSINRRAAAIVALWAAFLLIWIELAVGLFGSPIAGS